MGKLLKPVAHLFGKRKQGSRAFTGIASGDRGTNFAGAYPEPDDNKRRPGRRNAHTPLGPRGQKL